LEGEGFRDRTPDFLDEGAAIYGVSFDQPDDNRSWAEMMGFEFPLLSDPDHILGRQMGVEREPDDRLYGLPRRVTFLIDPAGVVRWTFIVPRDEISSHVELTLSELRAHRGAEAEGG
jgi:peroxiredoxin Q/BCP